MSVIVLTGSALALVVRKYRTAATIHARMGLSLVMSTFAAFLILATLRALGSVDYQRIAQVRASQTEKATSGFDLGQQQGIYGIADLVAGSLATLPRALLGPYPWELSSSLLPLLPDAIFWWVILASSALSLRRGNLIGFRMAMLAPFIGLIVALSVYSGNYGTMLRIRAQAVIFLVPLVAVALSNSRQRAMESKSWRVRVRK